MHQKSSRLMISSAFCRLKEQTYQIPAVQVLSPAKAKLEQELFDLQQYAVLTHDESVYDDSMQADNIRILIKRGS
jgi:hypothetical protein